MRNTKWKYVMLSIILLCVCFSNVTFAERITGWEYITGSESGLNVDPGHKASRVSTYTKDGILYVAWVEENSEGKDQIRVSKFENEVWTSLDGGGETGINYSQDEEIYGAFAPALTVTDSGAVYVAWDETKSGEIFSTMHVKKYESGMWQHVISKHSMDFDDSTITARFPSLAADGEVVYLACVENFDYNRYRINVQTNKTGIWRDTNALLGLQGFFDNMSDVPMYPPKLVSKNGEVYIAYRLEEKLQKEEYSIINVGRYTEADGWSRVDYTEGNVPGLNIDWTKAAYDFDLYISDSGKLYVTWTQDDQEGVLDLIGDLQQQDVVRVFSKEIYQGEVNTISSNFGVNYGQASGEFNASSPSIVELDNIVTMGWSQSEGGNQFRIKKNFTDDRRERTWFSGDGDDLLKGINKEDGGALYPQLEAMNGYVYGIWVENSQVQVARKENKIEPTLYLLTDDPAVEGNDIKLTVQLEDARYEEIFDEIYRNDIYFVLSENIKPYYKIDRVMKTGQATVDVYLEHTNLDFDEDIEISLTVRSRVLEQDTDLSSEEPLVISAVKDEEKLLITSAFDYDTQAPKKIYMGEESSERIIVTLEGGIFSDKINSDNWTVDNLPDGVEAGTILKTNDHQVAIYLNGNSRYKALEDITNITVKCTASEYDEGDTDLVSDSGFIIYAVEREALTVETLEGAMPGIFVGKLQGQASIETGGRIGERGFYFSRTDKNLIEDTEKLATEKYGNFEVNVRDLELNQECYYAAYAVDGYGKEVVGEVKTLKPVELIATPAEALTEENIAGNKITLALTGGKFDDLAYNANAYYTAREFNPFYIEIVNGPEQLSVKNAEKIDDQTYELTLTSNPADFDQDIDDLKISIEYEDGFMYSTSMSVTATREFETLTAESADYFGNPDRIEEGLENNQTIRLILEGGTFSRQLKPEYFTLKNAPQGVKIGSVSRADDQTVSVGLSGNSTQAYAGDITNISVIALTQALSGGGAALESNEITFYDLENVAVVTDDASGVSVKSATFTGSVNIAELVTNMGVKISSTSDFSGYTSTLVQSNTYNNISDHFELTTAWLWPGTTYYYYAYAETAQGTVTGEVKSFTTSGFTVTASSEITEDALETTPVRVTFLDDTFRTMATSHNIVLNDSLNSSGAEDWYSVGKGTWTKYGSYISGYSSGMSMKTIGDTSWTDYTYQLDVDYDSFGMPDAGAVFRCADTNNYYQLKQSYNKIELWKVVNGAAEMIISRSAGDFVDEGFTYSDFTDSDRTLLIKVEGENIVVSVNKFEIMNVQDAAHSNGNVGFYVNGSQGRFIKAAVKLLNMDDEPTLNADQISIFNGVEALSVASVAPVDAYNYDVTLAYDGDFDTDIENLHLQILASGESFVSTEAFTIKALDDVETITISNGSDIVVGSEDGKSIIVEITGGEFSKYLNVNNWFAQNLPYGVRINSVFRMSDTKVALVLGGNAYITSDEDITNVKILVSRSEFSDSSNPVYLSADSGVTLLATGTPVEETEAIFATQIIPITSDVVAEAVLNASIAKNQFYPVPTVLKGEQFEVMLAGGDRLANNKKINSLTVVNPNKGDGYILVRGVLSKPGLNVVDVDGFKIIINVVEPGTPIIENVDFN